MATKETRKEIKKRSMRDITNFEVLKLLEKFNLKFSVKIDENDENIYIVFVRKENVVNEMQAIALNRLHFGKGTEAYIKKFKKGLTPYELMKEESDQYKLEHPDYISKRERIESTTIEIENIEKEGDDTEDIPF